MSAPPPYAKRWLLAAAAALALAVVLLVRVALDRSVPVTPETLSTTEPAPSEAPTTDPRPPPPKPPTAATASTSGTPTRGVDLALTGRVRGRADANVPGARVEAWLDDGDGTIDLGGVACEPNGTYRLELGALAALGGQARALSTVVARASADGWQTQTHRRPIGIAGAVAGAGARDLTLDFRLERGLRLFGRVVDARGKPVARATVRLCAAPEREGDPFVAVAPEVATSASGHFEIGFASAGSYALVASAVGIGTALKNPLELEVGGDRRLGDVVLAGAGELAGRVRDPSGAPVASLELCAVPEELARDAAPAARAALLAPRRERGDGAFTSRTTTDASGAFRIAGLREGRYALFSTSPTLVLAPERALFATGAHDIALTLDAHRLVVRVRDSGGRPLRGAIVACARVEIGDDGRAEPQSELHGVTTGSDAACTFEIEPDTSYAVIAQAPGSRRSEELCAVAPGEHQKTIELHMQPLGADGRLRVTVLGARGEALDGVQVLLRTPRTGQRLRDFGWLSTDEGGWLPPLPAGEYGVEIGFAPSRERPPMHFPFVAQELAVIHAGAVSEIALRARAGGRLSVRLDVDAPLTLSKVELERAAELAPETASEMLLAERGAEATLFAVGSEVARSLQFARPATGPDDPYAVQSRLLPGTASRVDDLIEPGGYILRVRAPGFRDAETPVEVVAGVEREVRLALVRE